MSRSTSTSLQDIAKQKSEELGKTISIYEMNFMDGLESDITRPFDSMHMVFDDKIEVFVHSELEPLHKKSAIATELNNLGKDGDNIIDLATIAATLDEFREKKDEAPAVFTSSVITASRPSTEGVLVRSTSLVWNEIVDRLKDDWTEAYRISPRTWEEIIAGAFKKSNFDEVIL